MASEFPKSEQMLRVDSSVPMKWLLFVGLLVGSAWSAWALRARITRYEVSDSARLEVSGSAVPVEAGVAGRVAVSHLIVGRQLRAGDLLLELEDRDQRLALQAEQTRRTQLQAERNALRLQWQSEEAGRQDDQRIQQFTTGSAQAQWQQALSEVALAQQQADRARELRAQGLISQADAQKAQAAFESSLAAAENRRQAHLRLAPELDLRQNARTVRQRQIMTDIAKVDEDWAASNMLLENLRYQRERRQVRTPASGRLTACLALHPGMFVTAGQQLGLIVPPGRVLAVADFSPTAAFGKLHAGQSATLRLNGFPWAQFGVLQGTVTQVAGEIRDGKVRVEVSLSHSKNSRIPLQHGLPGTLEIEVERVTPAALLLRSAGQVIGAR